MTRNPECSANCLCDPVTNFVVEVFICMIIVCICRIINRAIFITISVLGLNFRPALLCYHCRQ
jgi:hypothetical protein